MSTGRLTIDLDAVVANWRALDGTTCLSVVYHSLLLRYCSAYAPLTPRLRPAYAPLTLRLRSAYAPLTLRLRSAYAPLEPLFENR